MYNQKVMDIFADPKNVGVIENADGVGMVGNPSCGDIMKIYLKIDDKEVITDAKFQTFGCAAAITTSSVATTLIIGKTVKEALKVTNKDVIKEIGDLPAQKHHCSVLAEEAIGEAIKDYKSRKKAK